MVNSKLPKDVIMMIEKNNPVVAIKTLAKDRGISMEEAKALVDDYEAKLIANQNKKMAKIDKKQGLKQNSISNSTASTFSSNTDTTNDLSNSVSNHLHDIGYKKPLIPYWVKRVAIMIVIMVIVFLILWRQFG